MAWGHTNGRCLLYLWLVVGYFIATFLVKYLCLNFLEWILIKARDQEIM